MRKLKLQINTSIDGFIAGANGEMDWMVWNWDDKLKEYVTNLMEGLDTILLGRNLAEGFIPHWTAALEADANEPGAEFFVKTPKVVFSRQLTESKWPHTVVNNNDLATEVNQIKAQPGGDLIAYGGGQFVSSLFAANLIDEMHMFVNPTVLGKGMPIFQQVEQRQGWKLVSATSFDCGIVALRYQLAS